MLDLCPHTILIENFFDGEEVTLVFGCEVEDKEKKKCPYPARLCIVKIQWEELYNFTSEVKTVK